MGAPLAFRSRQISGLPAVTLIARTDGKTDRVFDGEMVRGRGNPQPGMLNAGSRGADFKIWPLTSRMTA